ncbi:hypothetical protein K4K49_008246 [Colletotrichum sp. SAR 10_70]|nr:hypothetical protein K4K49_008246 [Colletotrichum sp. SAR 10_70]KAI8170242.1 hypothetical protein K4K50_009576 [Colletotrichum sp. SAR 10_71]KAI8191777.1 hypothetical protein K4K51_009943 [Colletotrichum sp. SAR 10_75]
MLAIVVKEDVTIAVSNGSVRIPSGTMGYLIDNIGNDPTKIRVQLVLRGKHGATTIPRSSVHLGRPHKAFRINLPRGHFSSVPIPLDIDRMQSVTGQAVWRLWCNIRDNLPNFRLRGLKRVEELEGLLVDETEFKRAVKYLVDSFTSDAWAKIKYGGTIKALMEIKPVTQKYPGLDAKQQVIYARIATNVLNPAPEHTDFAKYGGRTGRNPIDRQNQHEEYMNGLHAESPHYKIVKKYIHRVMLPMMKLIAAPEIIVSMAETTICCLFGTWLPRMCHARANADETLASAALNHRILLTLVNDLTIDALSSSNFPKYGGVGCNYSLPLEEMLHKKRDWVRYQVTAPDGRDMYVYRTAASVAYLSSTTGRNDYLGLRLRFTSFKDLELKDGTRISSQLIAVTIRHNLDYVKQQLGLRHGQLLLVSVERMVKPGERHPLPWYRHPYTGAWSNSDQLHSFGIRIEVMQESTGKWFSIPIQCNTLFFVYNPNDTLYHIERKDEKLKNYVIDKRVTTSWRMATHILSFLDNARYKRETCPDYLCPYLGAHIQTVEYDHLKQEVSFGLVEEKEVDPPTPVSFRENSAKMAKTWPKVVFGPQPPPEWFRDGGRNVPNPSCLTCWTNRQNRNVEENGCAKRQLPVIKDSDDPNAAYIRDNKVTCQLCWDLYRRPCAWVKSHVGYVEKERRLVLDHLDDFKGLYPTRFQRFPPVPIPDPINLDEYNALQEAIASDESASAADDDDVDEGAEQAEEE